MKKKLFFAALASIVLVGCTSNDFVGDTPPAVNGSGQAIDFGSGFKAVTRGDITGEAAATMLGNEMKVYGVKQNSTTTTNYDKVFVDYSVKYDDTKSANSEYNAGWYYVGAETGQVIKYWDYASDDYHFVAGSPVANFTYALDGTTGDIATATVTGLGGRLDRNITVASNNAPVYIADPVVVAKSDYQQVVTFRFKSLQTKVRVGIYETIPGYEITAISFYTDDLRTSTASNYISLYSSTDNYFQGGSDVTGTISYDWTTPKYTFTYGAGVTTKKFWRGGAFTTGVPATSSVADGTDVTVEELYGAETNYDAYGYFIVLPTASAIAATELKLTCDYTLTSLDGSGEVINVKGATATIPSAYTLWEANKAYTYLFKISDNTNGSTGTPGDDPEGLYPITFDAVVVNVEDGLVGTETTVSTPSITCYQDGDVVDAGITFVAGKDITIKVNMESDIEVKRLNGDFDYTKSYDAQDYSQAGQTFSATTEALLEGVIAKTYVIKATATSDATKVAYFVLVVGAAEDGPANN